VTKWLSALTLTLLCVACGGSSTPPASDATGEAPGNAPATATPGARPDAPAAADERTPAAEAKPAPPAFREVTLPEGTTLRLRLESAVASDSSKVEDTVRAELRQPVEVNGKAVLPTGTELTGQVTDVERSGRVKGRARIAYRFNTLRHDGESYKISTASLAHEAEGTKKEDAKKIGIGAGVGAAIGAIAGGGDGAAKGAAIGGGVGTGAVLATRGDEVRLGPGAQVTTRLTAPLTLRVKAS